MDEITTTAATRVSELRDGRVRTYEIDPLQYIDGLSSLPDFAGGDPPFNAAIVRRVLSGELGPQRDVVSLNAAAGIVAGGKADDLRRGLEIARDSIDSGRAMAALEKLVAVSNGQA
jgi:anthranilate phosphoribosyltransferase